MLLTLNMDEWFAALTFGVVIDADHLFAVPRYVSDNGISAILSPTWDDGTGLPWKSSFHHPEGAFVVGYLAIGWRLFIPFLFWGTHVVIDEFQLATIEHSAIIDSVFLSAVVGGIIALGYRRGLGVEPEGDFHLFLAYIKKTLKSYLSNRSAVRPLDKAIESHKDFAAGSFTASEMILFRSDLKPTGPVYTALAKFKLGV